MQHISISVPDTIEILNIEPTQISPLISKCTIKVCYVGDKPNRNKSVITKAVATEMAPTLRGCPIVGFYNENKEDYEEHNRVINISNGQWEVTDTTRPYGFVSTDAKVWFEKFTDDGVEHEYLMTEGYIWTGQYPESQRIIDKGNNQSMELDEKSLDAYWTKDINGKAQFFIINEAIMSKLCILGEDVEPCFEGATITNKIEFSFDNSVKTELFSLIDQMKEILNKGGTSTLNTYAVEIGSVLWDAVWCYLREKYPNEDGYGSKYMIYGVFEENNQKFIIVSDASTVFYRIDFQYDENGFVPSEELVQVEEKFEPVNRHFSLEDIEAYALEYKKKCQNAKDDKDNKDDAGNSSDDNQDPDPDNNPDDDDEEEEEDADKKKQLENKCGGKKTKHSFEEEYNQKVEEYEQLNTEHAELVQAYAALEGKMAELQNAYDALTESTNTLTSQLEELNNFKLTVERQEKENMINNTFYMLDAKYKVDVIENIDKYSLDEIEAKLSVICVRNKINFNLDDDTNPAVNNEPSIFNLNGLNDDDNLPAWFKAAKSVEQNMKNN